MRAAWYEKQGPPRDVLTVGEMPDPEPGPREVRIRIAASGVNPGDVKKREDTFGIGMSYPRVIPHSDGAGVVDRIGPGTPPEWLGRRVWCFGAQSYRPFGTAAEFTVVPVEKTAPLPDSVSMEQGACLGIPGITAHRAVHVAGPVAGHTVLVQGAAGAVGICAVQLAHFAGAMVIGTVRSSTDEAAAKSAGADHVFLSDRELAARVKGVAPDGIDQSSKSRSVRTSKPTPTCSNPTDQSPPTLPITPHPKFLSGNWSSKTSACSSSAATTFRLKPSQLPRAI